ncbi:MAG: N-acetylgalactosamine 6-sulfate sulfatase, partial [Victivallales bacterium]|nr:N-acetylgalactosamine 6-sulfate sulfatase [Victivallales bacterium]
QLSDRPNPIGFESRNQVSLTGNRYKIYSKDKGKTYELYDLIDDPGEKTNLAAQHPDIVQRLRQTVETWRQSCQDSLRGSDYGKRAQ